MKKMKLIDADELIKALEEEIKITKEKERQNFIEGNANVGFCLNGVASGLKSAIEIIKQCEHNATD